MSETESTNNNQNKIQLIYIFPNLFTAASIFVGVISVLASAKGDFDKAALYILLSLIFDGLDGRVARLTNTSSKFGAEFDSLADIVAFGVAPAMLFYYSIGIHYGKVGSLLTAMFVVFGAIRLARFNVMIGINEPSVFIGVPIPTAAVVLTMWILVHEKYVFFKDYNIAILVGIAMLALLMVSNFRYPSFKKINLRKPNFIKVLVYLVMVFSLVYIYPVESITIIVTAYLFYGVVRAIYNFTIAKYRKN
ncbi:CDP-diacylglycerol--serine O-phosphatidyltransferase [Sulfurospirillum sp. 1612]|uniref:CDP-diacylglycerol--serine O-phosphatidyltransferase n=1 Tax=Sulfurospirillum sp. 1612 TaxID=3094835 RepID=UPI002F925834